MPEEATGAPLEEDTTGRPLEEQTAEAGSSEEEAIHSAKKLRTVEREASYVIVASPGGIFRLHRAGSYGCWMGRKRDFRDATEFDIKPPTSRYTHVCKLCWPPKADNEDSEPARPRRPIQETARSLGTKLRGRIGDRALAPRRWGRRAVGTQTDTVAGLDFNQSLYDFIRDRM